MKNAAVRSHAEAISAVAHQEMPERSIDLVFLAKQSLGDRGLEIELLSLFEKQAETIAAR